MEHCTLIIWENIPESTDLYLVKHSCFSRMALDIIHGAHNQIINRDDDVGNAMVLNFMMTDMTPFKEDLKHMTAWYDNWTGYLVMSKLDPSKVDLPEGCHVTKVVKTGCMM